MAEKMKVAAQKTGRRKARCRHHWIIETPDGPRSRGVCKYCGATKEFDNYWPYSTWERYPSKLEELPVMPNIDSGDRDDR